MEGYYVRSVLGFMISYIIVGIMISLGVLEFRIKRIFEGALLKTIQMCWVFGGTDFDVW